MRKLLITVVLVLLAVTSGILVAQHYKNYQNKKTHEAAVEVQKKTDIIDDLRNEAKVNQNSMQLQVDKLTAECEKGVKAYETLTSAQKAKVGAPVCQP